MRVTPKPGRVAQQPAAPESTRARVLRIAWEMIDRQRSASITLVDVAREAGVSRQTVYLLFGNRAGLLLAMVDDVDERSDGPGRLAAAREVGDATQSLEAYARAWLDYLPVVFPVARALASAAASGDSDAAAAWETRVQRLRGGLLQVMKGLQAQGRLRPEWTSSTAADWAYSAMHVDVWQHLVVECRWKPRDAVERIVGGMARALLVDR
jgi:AcrR family transcriptional regulator